MVLVHHIAVHPRLSVVAQTYLNQQYQEDGNNIHLPRTHEEFDENSIRDTLDGSISSKQNYDDDDYPNNNNITESDKIKKNEAVVFTPSKLDLQIAARLVIDAKELRNVTFRQSKFHLRLYELYLNKWVKIGLYACLFVHLLILPLFEHPATFDIPFWIPELLEFVFLVVYTIRLIHAKAFQYNKDYYGVKKYILLGIVIIITALDLIQYLIVNSLDLSFKHRFTRPFRVFFFINSSLGKELRRALRNLVKTLPDIMHAYMLFFSTLLIFCFLHWQLFREKGLVYPDGTPYFREFREVLWQMYISITTANFPDIMQPAYNASGYYAITFIVFMILNLYLFVNITLATIYVNFKKHLEEEVKFSIRLRRKKLESAFSLLKARVKHYTQKYAIDFETFKLLMKQIYPNKSESKTKIIFNLLDRDRGNFLSFKEFLYFADLLNYKITEIDDKRLFFEKVFPAIYHSTPSRILKKFVRHRSFDLLFDILIILSVALTSLSVTELIFSSIFIFQISCKLYTYGFRGFFSIFWNIFDSVIVLATFILSIIDEFEGGNQKFSQLSTRGINDAILILRFVRLIKPVAKIKRFSIIINTVINLAPSLVTYVSLLMTIYYIFIMIGMEIYGDLIKTENSSPNVTDCSNPKLINSGFAGSQYCKNNFNKFVNAFVIMFELMVVNNWNVIGSGFVLVTSFWSRFYFTLFHIICVIITLNIFTAFVLELFWLEYQTGEKSLFETRLEQRIIQLGLNLQENIGSATIDANAEKSKFVRVIDKFFEFIAKEYDDNKPIDYSSVQDIRFHINSRGPMSIEILLQKMFSQEFEITNDAIFC